MDNEQHAELHHSNVVQLRIMCREEKERYFTKFTGVRRRRKDWGA